MSWYVKRLILDGASIKSKIIFSEEENNFINFDDDTYMDILSVEIKVKELFDLELLTEKEFNVIQLLYLGNSFNYVAKELGLTRPTVISIFEGVCTKLAFSLGDHFTNEGFINYISNKYSLQDEEIEIIKDIIYS